jgi:Protein of unknown function (DUF2971)
MLRAAFDHFHRTFANDRVLDTCVFCLSEHEKEDTDGLLSMWRGYGSNGNGAAIVFDTAKITAREDSPLIIANVHYGTTEARIDWLRERIAQFASILATSGIPDDKLWIGSYHYFYLQIVQLFKRWIKAHEKSLAAVKRKARMSPRRLGVPPIKDRTKAYQSET